MARLQPTINRAYAGMPSKKPNVSFDCGNFVERADGAIYVRFDATTAYFSHGKLIAVIYDGTLYRDLNETTGPIYRRVRKALMHQANVKKTKEVAKEELAAMVEVAIMNMAKHLIDTKMGIK